jgi:hypothetical protein
MLTALACSHTCTCMYMHLGTFGKEINGYQYLCRSYYDRSACMEWGQWFMLCMNNTDWDLEVCLNYECRRKQIRKPNYFNQWIDVRATYKVQFALYAHNKFQSTLSLYTCTLCNLHMYLSIQQIWPFSCIACKPPTTHPHIRAYHIHVAGTFRGRKLSRISKSEHFTEKTFTEC